MKKTVLLFSFIVFSISLFSQKTLSWKNRELANDKAPSVAARDNEAEVRIFSSLPLTFNSITKAKDKKAVPFKIEKEGPKTVYYFLFSALPKYDDRKLAIGSKEYKSIEIPLKLISYTISEYYVWDEEIEGVKGLVNEGNRLFGEGKYDQAKIKYLDAMDHVDAENQDDEDAIISLLDKADQCVIAKESADKFYNNKEWMKAKKEYEDVVTVNPADKFCKDRITTCIKEFENSPRIIRGKVTDINGKALADVNIVPLENGKKGIRTVTDSSGAFQITTVNKTTELIYWKSSLDSEKKIKITGDVMNFVAK